MPNEYDADTIAAADAGARFAIVRFRFRGPRRVIKRGLTLAEAQAHCRRDDTRGPGWFDGFERE